MAHEREHMQAKETADSAPGPQSRTHPHGCRAIRLVLMLAAATLTCAANGDAALASPATQSVAFQQNAGHDGHIADAAIATPLQELWSRTLPERISHPVIVNGTVYVTTTNLTTWVSTLHALDQASGATRWSRSSSSSRWMSPAYDRGQIFVVDIDGLLTALNAATGTTNWSEPMPGQYAFTSPPTAANGIVYVGGAGGGGTLYAVRERDGHVLWTRPVANGDNSSPAVDGDSVYVTYPCQHYAFDRLSGEPDWHYNGPCSGGGGLTAVVAAGRLFARPYEQLIHSAATGAILGALSTSTLPAVAGNVAYMRNGTTLSAIADAGLGATLWQFSGDGALETAPLVVGEIVFVGSSAGHLYSLDAGTGAVRDTVDVGAAMAAPAENLYGVPLAGLGAANGTLVVPAGDTLVAYRTAGAITQAPANRSQPTVDGRAQVGELLATDVGIWSNLPTGYSYAWQRCDGAGANCSDVAGATAMSFKPSAPDLGATFRVRVTASNASGVAAAITSAQSAAVDPAPPQLQTPPSITGTPREGDELVADPGTWTNGASSYGYAWQRCSGGAFPECYDIEGATESSYVAQAVDVGSGLRVRVVATNAGGDSEPASSATTSAVTFGPPVVVQSPAYSGLLYVGERLSADRGFFTNEPTSFRHQWFSCDPDGTSCPDIAGATQPVYVLRASDLGRFIGVEVVATNSAGDSEPEPSDAFGPVSPAIPRIVVAPSISGTPRAGSTLTATPGSWTANPTRFDSWWYRCDIEFDACAFTGATGSTYALGAADVGQLLLVGVVATNAGVESDEEISEPVGPIGVALAPTAPAPPPTPPAQQPQQPPASNAFRVIRQRVRPGGRLAFTLRAPRRGAFTGVATANAAALRDPCRPRCSATRRSPFGRGSVRVGAAGTVTLVVNPGARARAALRRRGGAIRVRVKVTFRPSSGRVTSQVRSLTVRRRQGASRSLSVSRSARQRGGGMGMPSLPAVPLR